MPAAIVDDTVVDLRATARRPPGVSAWHALDVVGDRLDSPMAETVAAGVDRAPCFRDAARRNVPLDPVGPIGWNVSATVTA